MKTIKIELDLPLVFPNNIIQISKHLIKVNLSYWTETIKFTISYFMKA